MQIIQSFLSGFIFEKQSIKKIGIFFFVIVFALYGNTLFNDYNLDDELVTRNHRLTSQGISAIPEIFSSPYYQDEMGYAYEYRPIVLASFAIEHQFFGESPFVSHFINVFFYAITIMCLFYLLMLLFPNYDLFLLLIITLFFLFFPLHTEVVANIKNRDIIFSLLFSLLSTIFLIKYYSYNNKITLLLFFIFFMLAILSKNDSIIFLVIIPISIIFFLPSDKIKLLTSIFLLTLASFFFLPIESIFYKILFYIFCYTFIFFIYFLKNNRIDSLRFKFFLKKTLNLNDINLTNSNQLNEKAFPPFLIFTISNLFCFISYTFNLMPKFVLFFSLLVLVIYLLFFTTNIFALFFFSLQTLVLHYFINENEYLYILLISNAYFVCKSNHYRPLGTLIFLLTNILHYYKFGLNYLVEHNFFVLYFIHALIFILIKNKALSKLLLLLSLVIPIYNEIEAHIFNKEMFNVKILYYLILASFPSIYLYISIFKDKYCAIRVLSLFFLIFYCYSLFISNKQASIASTNSIEYKNSISEYKNTITGVELSPIVQTDRPINFVEYPMNLNAPISEKIGTSFYILATYLKIMFFPFPMGYYYGYSYVVSKPINNLISILSIFLHLSLLIISLYLVNKKPILSFGILLYLISIAAFSNIVQPLAGVIADRFTYVTSLGFCIVLGYLFFIALKKTTGTKRNIIIGFFTIIICFYSYLTIARNAQWKNHLTLMRHDIKHLDNSAQAHNLLASNLMKYSFDESYSENKSKDEMRKEAAFHFKRATEIYPPFFNAWYDLGRTYSILNNLDSAYICFKRVHELDSTFSDATLNIAVIAEQKQDYDTAIYYYERLIKFNPYVQEAYANLSYLYFRLQQPKKSIEVNQRALAYNPNWQEPRENIKRVEEFLKQNNLPLE